MPSEIRDLLTLHPLPSTSVVRVRVEITGIVQGVGFRPFLFRLASRFGATGWVRNTPCGVQMEIQADHQTLSAILDAIRQEAPPLAVIGSLTDKTITPLESEPGFSILASGAGAVRAEIPPDGDLCTDCLEELFDPTDRRYYYPFITCTNCGPRYSIITGIPYDRPLTTMAGFPLCPACQAEYDDPLDRRFHAQPLACPVCGPQLRLLDSEGLRMGNDGTAALDTAVWLLKQGKILVIKGIGGFHLAVDAGNPTAVKELRRRKMRDAKPFALMLPDLLSVSAIAVASRLEERLLAGAERPIVLLRKRDRQGSDEIKNGVAGEVAPGSNYLGIMLPSTPLHHLLLHDFGSPLVMTSGNRSSEPIVFRDSNALERLAGIADAFLTHDRPIHTRVDDSVIRVFHGNPLFLRRSRGYAPRAILLREDQPAVLAVGAELKVACCMTRDSQAFMSQHIGDVQNLETLESMTDTIEKMKDLLKIEPVAVAHDMHPDYLSTRFAQERTGLPTIAVQHHHAHMASCMAENRLCGTAIGIIFDGTGFGPDGTVWGGEFLLGDSSAYQRLGRFRPVPLPGGDAGVREPYRMALSWCHSALGDAGFEIPIPGWSALPDQEKQLLRLVVQKRINSPLTSSCGRLFDAVATLVGSRAVISYEGQAAIELEAVAEEGAPSRTYPFAIAEADGLLEIDWRPLFVALVDDLHKAVVSQGDMARSFHAAVAAASLEVCRRIRETTGVVQVVLSGGVFQNRLLTEELCDLLSKSGFNVHTHRLVPPNDGGLALGQSVIAGRALWKTS